MIKCIIHQKIRWFETNNLSPHAITHNKHRCIQFHGGKQLTIMKQDVVFVICFTQFSVCVLMWFLQTSMKENKRPQSLTVPKILYEEVLKTWIYTTEHIVSYDIKITITTFVLKDACQLTSQQVHVHLLHTTIKL